MKIIASLVTALFLITSPLAHAGEPATLNQKADVDAILYYAHFGGREPLGPLSRMVTLEAKTFKRHLKGNPFIVTATITNHSDEPVELLVDPARNGVRHLSVFIVDEQGSEIPRTEAARWTLLPPGGNDLSVKRLWIAPKVGWQEGGQAKWELDLTKYFELPPGKYRASIGYNYMVASAPFEFEVVEVK